MTMQEKAKKALETEFVTELKKTAATYGYEVRHPWFTEFAPGDKNLQVEFWVDFDNGFEVAYKDRCNLHPSDKIEFEIQTRSWGALTEQDLKAYMTKLQSAAEFQAYLNNLDWTKAPVIQYEQEA